MSTIPWRVAMPVLATGAALAQPCVPRWDTEFLTPGTAVQTPIALAALDLGPGPTLFAAGFSSIAGAPGPVIKYDSQGWSNVGGALMTGQGGVLCLALYDEDGAGPQPPRLFAGGNFRLAISDPSFNIARLGAAGWEPVGPGLAFAPRVLKVIDLGKGPVLCAAGHEFVYTGLPGALGPIATWNGSAWSDTIGAGLRPFGGPAPHIKALEFGPGGMLYAGGFFGTGAGSGIIRWTGNTWEGLGGIGGEVRALRMFNDGSGPALFVGGQITSVNGSPASLVVKWDGSSWHPAATGLGGNTVDAFETVDFGAGPCLFAAGTFHIGPSWFLGRWDGSRWSAARGEFGGPLYPPIRSLAVVSSGAEAGLYTNVDLLRLTPTGYVSTGRISRLLSCPPCYVDCDSGLGDPRLNANDFLCFINRFAAADPYANCDGSTSLPVLNAADFACFAGRFAAGCP